MRENSADAQLKRALACEPYICRFPDPKQTKAGTRWTCGNCGSAYRMTRRKYKCPWRSWSAPHGRWVVAR